MLVIHGGGLVNTRGPRSQRMRSFERHELTPGPVAKNQYSFLHLTMVDGSCTRTSRFPLRTSDAMSADDCAVAADRDRSKRRRLTELAPPKMRWILSSPRYPWRGEFRE